VKRRAGEVEYVECAALKEDRQVTAADFMANARPIKELLPS
jgi:hypothetical protein